MGRPNYSYAKRQKDIAKKKKKEEKRLRKAEAKAAGVDEQLPVDENAAIDANTPVDETAPVAGGEPQPPVDDKIVE